MIHVIAVETRLHTNQRMYIPCLILLALMSPMPMPTEDAPRSTPRSSRAPPDDVFLLVRHKKVPELHHAMGGAGFNMEARDENGNTLLIVAAQNGEACLSLDKVYM